MRFEVSLSDFRKMVLSRLGRALLGVGGIKVISIFLGLALSVVLARTLGAESYGTYSYVMAVIAMMAVPVSTGVPTLVTRELAKAHVALDWAGMRGAIISSNAFILVLSAALLLLFFFAWPGYWRTSDSATYEKFCWAVFLVPLIAASSLRVAILKGLRRIVISEFIEKIVMPLMMISLVILWFYRDGEISYDDVIKINLIVAAFVFLIGHMALRMVMPDQAKVVFPAYHFGAWGKSIVPLSLFSAVIVAQSQAPLILLGAMSENEEVAMYRIAAQAGGLVAFAMTVVNMVIAPYIARLYEENQIERLQVLVRNSTRVIVLFSLPILFVFIFLGEWIIGFSFGDEYSSAYYPLLIVCIGQSINGFFGVSGLLLNMTGYEKSAVAGGVAGLSVNIVAGFLLIPAFDAIGAAFSMLVSITVWNIILHREALNRIGIDTLSFAKRSA